MVRGMNWRMAMGGFGSVGCLSATRATSLTETAWKCTSRWEARARRVCARELVMSLLGSVKYKVNVKLVFSPSLVPTDEFCVVNSSL